MEDVKQDVNPVEPSTTEEPVVNQAAETTEQPEQTQGVVAQVEGQDVVKDSRPLENLYWEQKRKVDELHDMVKGLSERIQQPQQQQPQYTKAQLRLFAEGTDNAAHKQWAYEELDKLERTERQSEMKDLFQGFTKKNTEEQSKHQSAGWVAQNLPQCFTRDAVGNLAWNSSEPLVQRINFYMTNDSIKNNPEGLIAAAKMAAFDLGVSLNTKLNDKVNRALGQLKKEQKKQLAGIGGGGTVPPKESSSNSKIQKLNEEYRKSGDKEVFKEILKLRGMLPAERQ